jgi:hypothetical protein
MLAWSNHADSTRMFFVSGVIIESQPPMTPASESGLRSSAMTRSSASSTRSVPSSSLMRSPLRARRTTMPPSIVSRSKACVGWPMPSSVKLLASTAFEICFCPSRSKKLLIVPELGPMVTLRSTRAVKRPQSSGASMRTGYGAAAGFAAGSVVSSAASGRL